MHSAALFSRMIAGLAPAVRPSGCSAMLREPLFSRRAFHASLERRVVQNIRSITALQKAAEQHETMFVGCYAKGSPLCAGLEEVIEQFSEVEAFKKKVHFLKFDYDELSSLRKPLQIHTVPTFLVFRNGSMVRSMGGLGREQVLKTLRQLSQTWVHPRDSYRPCNRRRR
ncbi:hypothetical protein E4U19_005648 [Claviceps sp. Clav32 group G5]|nr:hypothetical protein E4U40_007892 [Claviceps sp. LM458 group G5]KAG6034458.1 hypothetical protein E4U19_005648 [Claviceps sp. Clav32 group G5]KAG6048636.1 hypothetical protein E4U39_007140 [Claviceps sp. Clav50 group G5]